MFSLGQRSFPFVGKTDRPAIVVQRSELLFQQPLASVIPGRISFGDSGCPLVNPKGELIAVTFAIPSAEKRGASTLSYHVHLDEVKAFVADRPGQPPLHIPSPWPMGEYSEVKDLAATQSAPPAHFFRMPFNFRSTVRTEQWSIFGEAISSFV